MGGGGAYSGPPGLDRVNDICNSSNLLDFFIFADDINLLYADKSVKNLEITVNKELAKVSDWLIANKLALNSILTDLYRSLILPYLSYGIVAWGRAAKLHISKLLILQKRALRLMHFADKQQHAIPFSLIQIFFQFKWFISKKLQSLMHDVSNIELRQF